MPRYRTDDLPPALAARLVVDGECWLWQGATTPEGYGVIRVAGVLTYVHRVALAAVTGPLDPDLPVDHLCRVRHCANPSHLEQVTTAENNRRAAAARSSCPKGHELDGTYTRRRGSRVGTYRYCLTCNREKARARKVTG